MGKQTLTLSVAIAMVLTAATSQAAIVDATWVGGTGDWSDDFNWSGTTIPDNGADTYNVLIDDGDGGTSSDVTLDMNVFIDSLTVDASDMLTINNSRQLHIDGGVVNNAGTILVNSTGSSTYFQPRIGPVTLMGGGTVALSDSAANWIYQESGGSLINVDNTICGSGRLGWTSAPTPIDNQSLIVADQPTALIVETGSATFTNTGTLRATNGATLDLEQGTFENNGGVIEAQDGSLVTIDDVMISGGTLQTSGSGAIESIGTEAVLDGTANTITSSGMLRARNSERIRAKGILNNTGTIELNSTGSTTVLQPQDEVLTLTGGGTVAMSDSSANWIYENGGGSLVNVNNTIRGSGRIGWTTVPTQIDNQSLIVADQATALVVETGSTTFTNTGTLRATNGATLDLQQGTFENAGGVIEAQDGSLVLLDTVTISGGTLQTSGSGAIESVSTEPLLDGTANTVTNSGMLRARNSERIRAKGALHNTGTIELNSVASNTYLHPQDEVLTLTGGGTIAMSDSDNNWIFQNNGGSLVNVDNTIRGSGRLGWTSAPTPIDNQSLIVADQPTSIEVETGSATFTNTGTLRAANGGTLDLEQGTFENNGGIIEALDGSIVLLDTVTISGGTLQTSGTGSIESVNTTATLDGTVNTVTTAGMLRVRNTERLLGVGTLHNTGTIEINSTGSNTYLQPIGGQLTLTGGGNVVLSDRATNWIYRSGTGSLLNVDNTISGAGRLGWTSAPTLITNQGTVIANGTNELEIEAGSEMFDNQGTLVASGSGGILVSGGFTTSGNVTVDAGSSLSRTGTYTQTAGSTTVNGSLSATTGVDIQGGTLGGSGTVDDSVMSAGIVSPGESAGILSFNDDYQQAASAELFIEIGGPTAGADFDRLDITGTATLDGTLRVAFINGYDPAVGESFQVMTYANRVGDFADFDVPCLAGGKTIQVSVGPTNVTILVTDGDLADTNCDCALSTLDVELMVLALIDPVAYEAATPNCTGLDAVDLNGDTFVDGRDLQVFTDEYLP